MSLPGPANTTISTRLLTRIIIGLIAVWSLVAGIVLVGFHGAGAGALGAGVADEAGQRLVGAHMLVLVPAYLLLIWQPEHYRALLWLPFAAQLATAGAVGYSMLTGDIAFSDGALPVAVGGIFAGLLAFVWISEPRETAREKLEKSGTTDPLDASDLPPDEP